MQEQAREHHVLKTDPQRCPWPTDDLYQVYHDLEWGVPVHDDRRLFEMLILEGAQAGLGWSTVLKKRERYRAVFVGSTICYAFMPASIMSSSCWQCHARKR